MQTRLTSKPGRVRSGFTLVELLVTIAVIAVLAGILLPTLQRSMVNARSAKGISNLRQMGAAIVAYAGEHEETLPGPVGLGLLPIYSSTNNQHLAYYLATYLGMPDPTTLTGGSSNVKVVPAMLSPGMVAWNPATALATNSIPHYIQSDVLKGGTVSGGIGTVRPFGALGAPNTPAIKLNRLGDFTNTTTGLAMNTTQVWLLSDVDQQSTDSQAKASGWFTQLPKKPVYITKRLRIYADGHAEAAALTEP